MSPSRTAFGFVRVWALLSAWLLPIPAAFAGAPPPGGGLFDPLPVGSAKDAQALEAKRQAFLKNLRAYSFRMTHTVDESAPFDLPAVAQTWSVTVRRPDRLAVTGDIRGIEMRLVFDGKTATAFYPATNRYRTLAGMKSLEDLFKGNSPEVYKFVPFMVLPTHQIAAGRTIFSPGSIFEPVLLGKDDTVGVPCHHLREGGQGFRVRHWIEAGPQPLLRKSAGKDSAGGDTLVPEARSDVLSLDQWNTAAKPAEKDFAFTPPASAVRVERASEFHPLVGLPAPDFRPALPKGQVVLLSFWRHWVQTDHEGLPRIVRMAADLRDKGVRLCVVAPPYLAKLVDSDLAEHKLTAERITDADGRSAHAFWVDYYSQIVLIGRDGKVRAVQRGHRDEQLKELADQLRAAVAETTPAK